MILTVSPLAPLLTSSAQTFPAGIVLPARAGQHFLIVPSVNVADGVVQTVGAVGGENATGAAIGALTGAAVGFFVGLLLGNLTGVVVGFIVGFCVGDFVGA